ncbi:MAG: hypothetical protein ACK4SX_06955 [Alcanivoracaceae bacterium]
MKQTWRVAVILIGVVATTVSPWLRAEWLPPEADPQAGEVSVDDDPDADTDASDGDADEADPSFAPQVEQTRTAPPASGCSNGIDPDADVLPLLDRTHGAMSRGVCWPSQWFDRFFSSPDDINHGEAGTLIRVIGATRWQDNDDTGNEVRVRASVDLPNLSQRFSLVFRNDDDIDSDFAAGTDTRPETVGANTDSTFRAALRWAARQTERDSIDVEVGLRSELKTFIRGRYRITLPMPGDKWVFRFTEAIYWKDEIGFGTESRFEFGRPLTTRTVLRLTTEAELSEELHQQGLGWDLDQSVAVYYRINRKSAVQYTVGAQGFTEPSANVEVWRTSVRYRRNVWRPWLFWELEPFVLWPRIDDYDAISGVVFRLETQFGLYNSNTDAGF